MLIAMTNPEWCLVIAIALFLAAACLAFVVKSFYSVLMAVGLIFLALAFIVDP